MEINFDDIMEMIFEDNMKKIFGYIMEMIFEDVIWR